MRTVQAYYYYNVSDLVDPRLIPRILRILLHKNIKSVDYSFLSFGPTRARSYGQKSPETADLTPNQLIDLPGIVRRHLDGDDWWIVVGHASRAYQ
jgi:hypothetical protein